MCVGGSPRAIWQSIFGNMATEFGNMAIAIWNFLGQLPKLPHLIAELSNLIANIAKTSIIMVLLTENWATLIVSELLNKWSC